MIDLEHIMRCMTWLTLISLLSTSVTPFYLYPTASIAELTSSDNDHLPSRFLGLSTSGSTNEQGDGSAPVLDIVKMYIDASLFTCLRLISLADML